MRCNDFQNRWQALLDERRSPQQDELLRAHAAKCGRCRELLRVQTVLFRELKRSNGDQAGELTNLHHSPFWGGAANAPRTRWKIAKSLLIGLAIAGSLMLMLVPAWRFASNGELRFVGRPRIARSTERGLAPTIWVAKTPSPSLSANSKAANAPLPDGLTSEQEALRKIMQNMAARLSDVPEEKLEPLDRIAGGFRPLANTLGVAWDALRRSIPVGRNSNVNHPQAILGWPGYQATV